MRYVALLLALAAISCGCELATGEFDAKGCEPDPPAACADIGDSKGAQRQGCCASKTDTLYFCGDGGLVAQACGDLSCDYDPAQDAMACVK
jgi:hypothetical protein